MPPDSTLLFAGDYQGRLGELPDLQREITLAITGSINAELKGGRAKPSRRAPGGGSAGVRRVPARPVPPGARRDRAGAGACSSRRAASRPTGRRPTSAWPTTTRRFRSSPTSRRRRCCPRPGRRWRRPSSSTRRWRKRTRPTPTSGPTTSGTGAAAEQEFRRALELRPNYADAYFSYSRFLASRRRLDEAIAQLGRAVELDPLSLPLQANRALLDYFAGRYDEAGSRLREVLKSDSTDVLAKWGLALVAEQQGRPGEAIALLEPISGSQPQPQVVARPCLRGRRARPREARKRSRRRCARPRPRATCPPTSSRWCTPASASATQALRYLERAYEERSTVLAYLLIDPRLAPLRDDASVSRVGPTARRGVSGPACGGAQVAVVPLVPLALLTSLVPTPNSRIPPSKKAHPAKAGAAKPRVLASFATPRCSPARLT